MKMPSKEQILEASKDCPDAKEVLAKLFPEAFKEEKERWKRATSSLKVSHSWQHPGRFCFDDGENVLFWGDITIFKTEEYDAKIEDGDILVRKKS